MPLKRLKHRVVNWLLKDIVLEEIKAKKIVDVGGPQGTGYLNKIKFDALTSDPTLAEGLMWFRSDLDELRFSPDGTTAETIYPSYPASPIVVTASDVLRHSNDAEKNLTVSGTYVKAKEIISAVSGRWRVYFEMRVETGGNVYGRVYRNGSAYGAEHVTTSTSYVSFTDDLNFGAGDYIQLYVKSDYANNSVYVRNFRLLGNINYAFGYNTLT